MDALVVLHSPTPEHVGARVVLEGVEPYVAGRGQGHPLLFQSGAMARTHARFTWHEGTLRWSVTAVGPVVLGKERLRTRVLEHGDVLHLGPSGALKVERDGVPPRRHPELEATLASRWNDGALGVYADWLVEAQSPLGEWMTRVELVARRPGVLRWAASLVAPGVPLELDWHLGFVRGARVVRRAAPVGAEHRWACAEVCELLLGHPQARFLSRLEIDLESFRPASAPHVAEWSASLALPTVVRALRVPRTLDEVVFVNWREPEPSPAALHAIAPGVAVRFSTEAPHAGGEDRRHGPGST